MSVRPLWLYLHFPHLQLDSINYGDLIGDIDSLSSPQSDANEDYDPRPPVIILDEKSNQILQVNTVAKASGITPSMGLATAAALNQHLLVVPYKREAEHKKLTEIAEHLYLVTSDISLFQPNGILLRIHNMLSLYGGLKAYWHTLSHHLSHFNVHYLYATGQSPYAARLLARTGWNQICDHLPMLTHQVGLCALTDSELHSKMIHKLTRVGIDTLADLVKIPLSDIAKRFDIDLVTYLGRLSGEFHHPIHFYHPQSRFQRYTELLYDITHTDTLLKPMEKQLEALQHFLKVRNLLVNEICFSLYQRDAETLAFHVSSAQPEYLVARWLSLITLKVERLTLSAPVYALALSTGETQTLSPDKTDLFTASQGTLTYLQLIAVLQARLGEKSVQSVCMKDDFRPEHINHYYAPQQQKNSTDIILQPMRPSFLFASPEPLTEHVSVLHGPERISTGWWDNQTITRDYFVARNRQGQWLWLFRTPALEWFVHGIFS